MTIAKKKLSDNVSNVFFFSFFLTFVTLFSTVKLSSYLFFDSIHGEEMMRRVRHTYERHLPLQNWGDIVCPCKREVPNLANVGTCR